MMKMMTMEKVGEVFRRPSSLFNNPFISFLKHSLGFTHNRDDQNNEDLLTIKSGGGNGDDDGNDVGGSRGKK